MLAPFLPGRSVGVNLVADLISWHATGKKRRRTSAHEPQQPRFGISGTSFFLFRKKKTMWRPTSSPKDKLASRPIATIIRRWLISPMVRTIKLTRQRKTERIMQSGQEPSLSIARMRLSLFVFITGTPMLSYRPGICEIASLVPRDRRNLAQAKNKYGTARK